MSPKTIPAGNKKPSNQSSEYEFCLIAFVDLCFNGNFWWLLSSLAQGFPKGATSGPFPKFRDNKLLRGQRLAMRSLFETYARYFGVNGEEQKGYRCGKG